MPLAMKHTPLANPGSLRAACGLHFELFSSAEALPEADWRAVVDAGHVFLQPAYLRALERSRPERMTFFYALFRDAGRPVAVASFQCVDFGMDGFGPNLLPEGAAGHSFVRVREIAWTTSRRASSDIVAQPAACAPAPSLRVAA